MPNDRGARLDRLAAHQKDAVIRLEQILSERWGAILADEPGLGKTYVAAALAGRRRRDGTRIEVVVPASLRVHWRRVLEEFDVEARIVTHTSLAREKKSSAPGRRNLVIVDEAHRFRNPSTKRYGELASRSMNTQLLFVTATPVCNSPVDLLNLVKLIAADDELESTGVPSIEDSFVSCDPGLPVVLREFCVRHSLGESGVDVESFREEVVSYRPVECLAAVEKGLERLTFPWTDGRVSRRLMLLLLRRRLESSVAALRATLQRMRRVCGRAADLAKRGKSLTASELRRVFGDPDAGAYQDILFPGFWGATERIDSVDDHSFERELRCLTEVEGELGGDPKIDLLRSVVRHRAGVPGLIFTGSFDTAVSLHSALSGGTRCALLSGRTCLVSGRRVGVRGVVDAMRGGRLDLVVATDVGAEGLNLQAAGFVVHYDLPWNPAVVEQRNGRILRIGQERRRLDAIYMIPEKSRVLPVLAAKQRTNAKFLAAKRTVTSDEPASSGWCPPPRLERWRPQVALIGRLRASNLASTELANFLSFGYREGVERSLAAMLQMPIGRTEVDRLTKLLRNEWRVGFRRGRSHIILS